MPDATAHALTFSKAAAAAASFISVVFDVPAGVFMAGFAGAWLAVAISDAMPLKRGAMIIAAGATLAAMVTPAIGEVLRWAAPSLNSSVLLKLVALVAGFAPWHKDTREWLISRVRAKGEAL